MNQNITGCLDKSVIVVVIIVRPWYLLQTLPIQFLYGYTFRRVNYFFEAQGTIKTFSFEVNGTLKEYPFSSHRHQNIFL